MKTKDRLTHHSGEFWHACRRRSCNQRFLAAELRHQLVLTVPSTSKTHLAGRSRRNGWSTTGLTAKPGQGGAVPLEHFSRHCRSELLLRYRVERFAYPACRIHRHEVNYRQYKAKSVLPKPHGPSGRRWSPAPRPPARHQLILREHGHWDNASRGRLSVYFPAEGGPHLPTRRDGRLSWPSQLVPHRRWFTRPKAVTHLNTNRAWRRLTSLIRPASLTAAPRLRGKLT